MPEVPDVLSVRSQNMPDKSKLKLNSAILLLVSSKMQMLAVTSIKNAD